MKLDKNNVEPKNSKLLRFVLILIGMLGAFMLSVFGIGLIMIWLLQKLNIDSIVIGILASQLSILFFGLFLFDTNRNEILKSLEGREINKQALGKALFATLLILIVNVLMNFTFSKLGFVLSNETSETTETFLSISILASFIFPVIIAPFIEEFTFRAAMKRFLVDFHGLNNTSYIFVSSLLFGLLHWQPGILGVVQVIVTGIIGLIYSILYIKTSNIYIPIISHMIYNFIVVSLAWYF